MGGPHSTEVAFALLTQRPGLESRVYSNPELMLGISQFAAKARKKVLLKKSDELGKLFIDGVHYFLQPIPSLALPSKTQVPFPREKN